MSSVGESNSIEGEVLSATTCRSGDCILETDPDAGAEVDGGAGVDAVAALDSSVPSQTILTDTVSATPQAKRRVEYTLYVVGGSRLVQGTVDHVSGVGCDAWIRSQTQSRLACHCAGSGSTGCRCFSTQGQLEESD